MRAAILQAIFFFFGGGLLVWFMLDRFHVSLLSWPILLAYVLDDVCHGCLFCCYLLRCCRCFSCLRCCCSVSSGCRIFRDPGKKVTTEILGKGIAQQAHFAIRVEVEVEEVSVRKPCLKVLSENRQYFPIQKVSWWREPIEWGRESS